MIKHNLFELYKHVCNFDKNILMMQFHFIKSLLILQYIKYTLIDCINFMLTKQMCIECHRPPSNWEKISRGWNLCLKCTLCILINFIMVNSLQYSNFYFQLVCWLKQYKNDSYNVLSPLKLIIIESPKTRFKQQSCCNSQQPLHHAFHK